MSVLITGSIGIDTVEAPSGIAKDALGGAAIYASYAASFFCDVRFVGVVGEDCPPDFLKPLHDNQNIDMGGLEIREGSKTFRWHGKYHEDVNIRDTISVDLNVLAERGPSIPPAFADSQYVFLANRHPALQLELLDQCSETAFVVADTMDLWIEAEPDLLSFVLARIDGVVLNDSEAVLLTGKKNIIEAGLEIAAMCKQFCVIKKGEHGSVLFIDGQAYPLPGYPTEKVVDPTGAGDSFAGGMMGHICQTGQTDTATLRRAIAYGTVTASLELEDFSLNRFLELSREDIDARFEQFKNITEISD